MKIIYGIGIYDLKGEKMAGGSISSDYPEDPGRLANTAFCQTTARLFPQKAYYTMVSEQGVKNNIKILVRLPTRDCLEQKTAEALWYEVESEEEAQTTCYVLEDDEAIGPGMTILLYLIQLKSSYEDISDSVVSTAIDYFLNGPGKKFRAFNPELWIYKALVPRWRIAAAIPKEVWCPIRKKIFVFA